MAEKPDVARVRRRKKARGSRGLFAFLPGAVASQETERAELRYAGNAQPQPGIDRPAEPGHGVPGSLFLLRRSGARMRTWEAQNGMSSSSNDESIGALAGAAARPPPPAERS